MALHGVERATRGEIRVGEADRAEEAVARLARELRVAAVVGVAVVVGPVGGDHALHRHDWAVSRELRCRTATEERLFEIRERATRAVVVSAQALHDRDEAVVAQRFEFANRGGARLGIRLRTDRVEQFIGELRHVHELRPRPLERRAELGHEVAHARLAAGDAIDEERAHERPAQSRAETHRVVDLLGGGDAVVDEPQGLAPQCLHQSVGDEAVDLLLQHERLHADVGVDLARSVLRRLRRAITAADLHERHQVHGVERMADDEALRVDHVALDLGGEESRGGGSEHGVAGCCLAGLGEHLLLQLESLGQALLHEVDAGDGVLDGRRERDRALLGERGERQLRIRATRVRHDLVHLARRLGIDVVQLHVDAGECKACGPTAADDASTEEADRAQWCRHVRSAS